LTGVDFSLQRLLSWLSPSCPVGSFSYSHGIEQATEDGTVRTATDASRWIGDLLEYGAGRIDGASLAEAYRTFPDMEKLREIAEMAVALSPSRELRLEATSQGNAFWKICSDVWPVPGMEAGRLPFDITHAVAVGWFAAGHAIPLAPAMTGYLHAFAANLVSAIVRLVPLGQTDGQRCMQALEDPVARVAEDCLDIKIDDVRTCVIASDICSMRHETQRTRLFRS
jgi:urease accessory protein